ncbi:HAD family hydrolase [Streptococcus ruminantium]|uniref:HAD family hydrolase n=1 Tax=Streptococcus ruminantium TaxID=1917441 RepID=UPI0012DD4561|nr:HAD family hydrolase [Streptococcus ruminantium]BDD43057.1 HAD family hydrolase [Streptococcus ruminantium]
MKALIFDLDDTLYNQLHPFQQALEKHLQIAEEDIAALYLAFRHYADEVFEATATGKMSLKDSHVYRMKRALVDIGYRVSDDLALAIQMDYDYFQGHLELNAVFPDIFRYCKERDITIGIITNGPYHHQLKKIRSLGLFEWFDSDLMMISGQVGVAKPHPAIFHLMEEKLGLSSEEICYLGDSFENDVVGAKSVGWKAIWFNHRKREVPVNSFKADSLVDEWDELEGVIRSL